MLDILSTSDLKTSFKGLPALYMHDKVFWFFVRVLGLALLIGFGSYIFITNASATQGFALDQLKEDSTMLKQEMQDMDIAIASLQTLFALKSSNVAQRMVTVDNKEYVYISAEGRAVGIDEEIQELLTTGQEFLNSDESNITTVADPM